MDDPDFVQSRYYFNKRSYKLTDNGIVVSITSFLSHREFKIPYEVISEDTYIASTYSKIALWFFVGLLAIGVISLLIFFSNSGLNPGDTLIYFVFAVPFGARFFMSRVKFVGLQCGGQPLLFYFDNPSENVLKGFMGKLQEQKHSYIESHYVSSASGTVPDQLEKLARLKEMGAITEAEFDSVKKSIIESAQSSTRKIGF